MSEITIALDAGHGGSNSGAVYKSRKEKDDTLRLTRAVGQILENSGINVYYVREDDEYETPFKKATDANNAGADYFVSIHRNSSRAPEPVQRCGNTCIQRFRHQSRACAQYQ